MEQPVDEIEAAGETHDAEMPAEMADGTQAPARQDEELFAKVAQLIDGKKKVLVSGHLSPDGDSIGSMIAVVEWLKAQGVDAVAAADIKSLGKMAFLKGTKEFLPLKRIRRKRFDLLVTVDCANVERLPQEVRPFVQKIPVVAFDHHLSCEDFGDVSVIDPDATAAAVVVWRFAKYMGWQLTPSIAEALWVALITDSGRFAYQSTSPETMFMAAELMQIGVDTNRINDIIFNSFNTRAIKLKRILWRSLHIWKNRKVTEVSLTRDDFRSVRGTKADAEDGVEIPRSVMRNEIALYFYQIPDRTRETRVSIRTRGQWDATLLAGQFGGGGHLHAAGCTITGNMATAKRLMRKAVKDLLAGKLEQSAPVQVPQQ